MSDKGIVFNPDTTGGPAPPLDDFEKLAAAYRERCQELDKTYLDLCIKTRTANREHRGRKKWFRLYREKCKEYDRLLIWSKEAATLLEYVMSYNVEEDFMFSAAKCLKQFEEVIK